MQRPYPFPHIAQLEPDLEEIMNDEVFLTLIKSDALEAKEVRDLIEKVRRQCAFIAREPAAA